MSKYQYKRLKKADPCEVWIPVSQSFCEKPVYLWRRCQEHYAALKHDDLYETFRAMSPEERKTALDMLDNVQKHRSKWEYEPQEELPEV